MSAAGDNRARWRAAMQGLGVDTVRAKLELSGSGGGADVMNIVGEAPHPPRKEVERWLAEQATAELIYRRRVDTWTLVFAAIAAVTGIMVLILAAFGH